jgi:rubredoxin
METKMNWKDVFSSRSRYYRTVITFLLLSGLFLLVALVMLHEYKSTGGVTFRLIHFQGDDALNPIIGFFILMLITLAYASFVGLYGIWFFKSAIENKEQLLPENWVCTKCGNTFPGDAAKDKKCPTCAGTLEDLDGYFDRHPERR